MAIGELFTGNALGVVDAKSRASLPAAFRVAAERRAQRAHAPGGPAAEKAVYLDEHPRHPCVQGYDLTHQDVLFQRLQARVAGQEGADPLDALDDEQLMNFSTGQEVGYDPSGRFVLPSRLRQVAGIELGGVALFVGAGETFQLWSPDRFRAAFHDNARMMRAVDALLDERRPRA